MTVASPSPPIVSSKPAPAKAPGRRKIDWTNSSFLLTVHGLALAAIAYMIFVNFSWATIALAGITLIFSSISITGGYHRLFSHPTYKSHWTLRLFYLLFGSAAVQNSALKWSSDHRTHHQHTDSDDDPYSIAKGFWWAHMGWVFFKDERGPMDNVNDLMRDPLVRFQHRFYVPLVVLFCWVLPAAIASSWGDAMGGFLVVGCLRLVVQYHATFSINSLAHMIGSRPYCKTISARDSFITAIISLGEGYHNFHHRFPNDYRNGVQAHHFDPTKWFVWTLSKVRITRDLKRMPKHVIEKARVENNA